MVSYGTGAGSCEREYAGLSRQLLVADPVLGSRIARIALNLHAMAWHAHFQSCDGFDGETIIVAGTGKEREEI